ncbi:MAG: MBL fold metallo-hydrolase [Gammaproteobacteria bacterium]|nr:MBL fold metallo-hydrolase [Gammaproteobacteria bacterium]MDH5692351.1 MBL fold metallo-hydrolase [Gammaproteobacteria bacterium]
MKVRQLFDQDTWTYTYLVWDEETREAAIIDSVKEQFDRDSKYIEALDLNLKYALETHVHADHITASGKHRMLFGTKVGVHRDGGSECANIQIEDGDEFKLGSQTIKAIHTPGHTAGDVSFLIDGAVFTGDALLIRACGRTDFQQGDSATLYESITQKLFTLPDDTIVYPGHDYSGFTASTIGEEKALNPRLGQNRPKEAFMEIMDNMNLPKPKRIDIAVPGNLACGLA